jgi:transcriptional regulator with XRE-family HTH domain
MIGPNLTRLRKKAKLTQEELANKIGVHRGTYANYEAGKREPDLKTLRKIADLHEVSVDYLIGHNHNPTPVYEANEETKLSFHGRELTAEQMRQLRKYIGRVLLDDEEEGS